LSEIVTLNAQMELKSHLLIAIFWIFFTFSWSLSCGQTIKFKHLTVKEGLSNNYVGEVLQDKKGFIWLGTGDGLNRYDGYTFQIYRRDPNDNNTLSNNNITALFEDSQGIIWIGTDGGGLNKYDQFRNIILRYPETEGLVVKSILENTHTEILLAGNDFLGIVNRESGKTINWIKTWAKDLQNKSIMRAIRLNINEICVATRAGDFYIIEPKNKKIKHFKHERANSNEYTLENISLDKEKNLWLATRNGGGLCRFDFRSQTYTYFQDKAFKNSNSLVIRNILEINEKIWISTESHGLAIFDMKSQNFQYYQYDSQNPNSLTSNSVYAIFQDSQERVWVGTYAGGVNIYDKNAEKFSNLDLPVKSQVNCIWKDYSQRLWVGTEAGLVMFNNSKVQVFQANPNQNGAIPTNAVTTLYEDAKNQIWVGNWGGSFSLFNEKANNFNTINADPKNNKKLSNSLVTSINYSNEMQKMWIGTYGGGLNLTSAENPTEFSQFVHNPNEKNSISDNIIISIYEDPKKNIWVGTTKGLNLFDFKTQKFTRFFHLKNDKQSLSNDYIACMLEDSRGRFWVGTFEGLNQWLGGNKFKRYTVNEGLPNNSIQGILEDKQGNLWLSTNNGISKFNPEKQSFRNFDESDGLQSKQFKNGSFYKSKEGQFFFGGVNGLNAFYPDSIKNNPHLPEIYLTDFKIFNKSVKIGQFDSLLTTTIEQTKEITLSYRHSVFSFDFVALNFTQSEKNQYAYKMEGFDKDWLYVGNQRSATYTNLDAGTYTFRVKAANNDGLWNEKGISLKITILPPWWETWWFRTLAITLFLSSGIIYYRARMNAVKAQNRKLEHIVVLRTQEIAQKVNDLKEAYEEINTKNEALIASEKELRQNHEEIIAQRDFIENQNKNLSNQNIQINNSINAALTIQESILPPESKAQNILADYYIIYQPKDIVSGDFYLIEQLQGKIILVVADCTGHGVPGAFMSLISSNLLEKNILINQNINPADILRQLHQQVRNTLNQAESGNNYGLDIGIAVIEKQFSKPTKIIFAGAKRPLYFIAKNKPDEVQTIAGTRKSIGGIQNENIQFENHTIILPSESMIYLSSDGLIDQNDDKRNRLGSKKVFEILVNTFSQSSEEQKTALLNALESQMQGTTQRDDILWLGVRL
jgi:ligand-binding sensor domain-containing protein/serine phosphatase RsbU (regulator of sigma subunit)